MIQEYDGGIYWLLDCRFDFLIHSFMQEYRIKEDDIIFVQSYHGNARERLRKICRKRQIFLRIF